MGKIKTCVSLYSLQDEYLNHRMDLEQIMDFVKRTGAEGVEILPDQMLKNTPIPRRRSWSNGSAAWRKPALPR